MSQAHENSGGKTPMWVVIIEGILGEKDEEYTSFHDLAWLVSEGMQDFKFAVEECRHVDIARAFVIDQKEEAKAAESIDT